MKDQLSAPEEIIQSAEVQAAAKEGIIDLLKKGYVDDAVEIIDELNVSHEIIQSAEVQAAAKEEIIRRLKNGDVDPVVKIIDKLNVSHEIVQSAEVQAAAKEGIICRLKNGKIDPVVKITDELNVSHEIVHAAAKESIIYWLKGGYVDSVVEIIDKFNVPEEIIKSAEVQAAAKEGIICRLKNGEVDPVVKIIDELNVSHEIVHVAAKESIIYWLKKGYVNHAVEIIDKFNVPEEIIKSEEVHIAAKEGIICRLKDGNIDIVIEIIDKFNVSQEIVQAAAKDGIIYLLKKGCVYNAVDIIDKFNVPEEIIKSEEVQAAAKEGIIYLLKGGYVDNAVKIKDKFNMPEKIMQECIKQEITKASWSNVIVLGSHFSECQQILQDFIKEQKEIAKNDKLAFSERRKAFDALAGLAENGEISVANELSEIIKKRSKQKETPESKWGLDPAQEAAFYTLMRLDNPDSNSTLFSLTLDENVNSTVKYAVLKNLLRNDSNFLNGQLKTNLHAWLYSVSPKKTDWRDMLFVGEIEKIPSKELRDKSLQSLSIFKDLDISTFPLYKTWSGKYSNIPQNVFLQAVELDHTCESKGLLDKFQNLFTSIRKESSKKDSLLYGITNVLETDPKILKLLGKKLEIIDIGSKQDADLLSMLFRQVAFLNKIEQIKNYRHYDNNEDNDEDNDDYEDYNDNNADYQESDDQPSSVKEQEISPKILEIFNREIKGIEELNILLQNITTEKIREILPNENITAEKIEAIEKEWGDLEPIFTYLGRFPELKEYVAEIVANIDTAEGWKNWRYNLNKNGVKKQIGHLSEEQLEIWENDYFSEIGDIMIAESGSDKPKQIQSILQDAILQHRHIFNPEMGQNKNEFIQKTLEGVFAEMEKTPDKQSKIIDRETKNISFGARSIDALINFNNLPRVRQGIEAILSAGAEITPSSKIKNTIGFISACLPPELRNTLESNYARLEDQKKIAVDEFFTQEIRQAIEKKTKEIEENYQNALDADIWEKFQLDKNNPKNLEQFYQKRQELKSATDLLRLLDLSNKLIATNRIVEKEGKKGGETITSVLERLKKYFKDSPLAQDISNIEFVLKEKIAFGEKRRLAMIFTDNAQMLWQAGKYPFGNGSCQHYAEGSYANQLMGYVGDPNCKIAYLVDLNKLPQSVRSEIEEKGFEEIKDRIPKQELLNASLARSIIKMTRDRQKKPAILLEPTYSVVNKGDASMDRYFNLFIDLMVAEPMKAKMARGGGNESVLKGESLSPCGQYEDLDLSYVKFIHKLSKPTKEDIEIMERIRSSR